MVTIPDQLRSACDERRALVVLNDSGGKDSQAMRIVMRGLVPPSSMVVVHASLGDVEWPGALEHARDGAARDGIEFVVARARKTFFEMVEHRFRVRPGPNSPCWPSASNRQCTSDLKRGPIEREIRRVLKERGLLTAVVCMGIRSQESPARSKLAVLKRSERNSVAGRDWWEWLPLHKYTREEVFQTIADAGETPHPALVTTGCPACSVSWVLATIFGTRHSRTQICTGDTLRPSDVLGTPCTCRGFRSRF